ncbi:hypothetical protein MCUN1_003940 [Malassezia cuniculi]|uniref:BZIP domain-containing protein n=1 Tax=Malassezia cuniculi TaxID=948313 RepID=A0AAF0J888_9BASI|nr:hypothetical protein MCUN1_003940 [Malassezia cuniculi]
MQLAHAASRHDGDLSENARATRAKTRGREMGDQGRATKQLRVDEHVDDPALAWASAPPAYSNPHEHGEHNAYGAIEHGAMPPAFDPHGGAHFDPHAYAPGVVHDGARAMPPPAPETSNKHLTSEATGLVGARGKTGMTRQLSTSRRAEQNRNAQRVFRERKNKYIADLENKAANLENALLAADEHRRRLADALETVEILKRDNDTLRVALRALGGHQAVPSAPPLPLDRAHAHALLQTPFGQHGAQHAPRPAHGEGEQQQHAQEGENQDPTTAAAVAAAASGGAPYWLLEAVSSANQTHPFPVGHFSQLGDGSISTEGNPAAQQLGDQNVLRNNRGVARSDGIIDPSLDDSRQRLGHEEIVKNDADVSSNPDNLASLSAVAAAAAAASAQKQA